MTRFNFALNYSANPTGPRAKPTFKPRMSKVDIAKMRAHYIQMEKADKNYWKKKGKPGRPKRFQKERKLKIRNWKKP